MWYVKGLVKKFKPYLRHKNFYRKNTRITRAFLKIAVKLHFFY